MRVLLTLSLLADSSLLGLPISLSSPSDHLTLSLLTDSPLLGLPISLNIRGRELNTNLFFSNFLGAPGISRQKSRDIPPKSLVSLGFEGRTELFLAPTPSRGRPPSHPKISGPKSLGLGSLSSLKYWIDLANPTSLQREDADKESRIISILLQR